MDLALDDYVPTELARATTLPSRWYLDPAFLQAERERVFWQTWQWAGSTAQVREPGDFVIAELQGEPLVVVRGRDDVLRGVRSCSSISAPSPSRSPICWRRSPRRSPRPASRSTTWSRSSAGTTR